MVNQSKYWVWTLNNYTTEERAFIDNLVEHDDVAYVSYGLEIGESETPHLQGHLELKKRYRLSQLKTLMGNRVHLEMRKGTFEQAQAYVEKEGDFYTHGERVSRGQGARTDLDQLAQDIRNGVDRRALAETYGREFIRYGRGIDNYFRMFTHRSFEQFFGPFRWSHNFSWDRSVIMWGEAGIGKTEYAKYILPNALFVSHLDDLSLFNDEYSGIIFDDMDFTYLPRTSQIHLVDCENNRSIHIRYSTAYIPAHTKKIFLTNTDYGFCVNLADSAINRRCEVIRLE